jgi:uncharacterized protein YndB with AHSA1/START domain
MRELQTSTDIEAQPERVWAVLADLEAYADWNPFIRRITGPLEPGGASRSGSSLREGAR